MAAISPGSEALTRGNFYGEVKDWSPGKNKPRELAENVKKSEGPRVNKKGDEGGGLLDNSAFTQHSSFPMQSVKNQSEDLAHNKYKDIYEEGHSYRFLYLISHFSYSIQILY